MKRFSARSCAGFVLAFSFSVLAESFSYEVYALEGSGKRLLSKGQKTYSRTDVRVTTETAFFTVMVRKELDLGNGFSVGFSDDGKAAVEGIGLWMHRVPGTNEADKFPGFSWEWYNRASGGTFRKLQGAGTIQIQTQKIGKWEFVTRIGFLDQTIFRLSAERGANPGETSHQMLIKKGSVLIFPPTADPTN